VSGNGIGRKTPLAGGPHLPGMISSSHRPSTIIARITTCSSRLNRAGGSWGTHKTPVHDPSALPSWIKSGLRTNSAPPRIVERGNAVVVALRLRHRLETPGWLGTFAWGASIVYKVSSWTLPGERPELHVCVELRHQIRPAPWLDTTIPYSW
jgi:hypothetical protein